MPRNFKLSDATMHYGLLQTLHHERLEVGDLVLAKPTRECQVGWHPDASDNDDGVDNNVYTVAKIFAVGDNRQWVLLKNCPTSYPICAGCLYKIPPQQRSLPASTAAHQKEPA